MSSPTPLFKCAENADDDDDTPSWSLPTVSMQDYKEKRKAEREKAQAEKKPKLHSCLDDKFSAPGLHRLDDYKERKKAGERGDDRRDERRCDREYDRDRRRDRYRRSRSPDDRRRRSPKRSDYNRREDETQPLYTPFSKNLPSLKEMLRFERKFEQKSEERGVNIRKIVERSEFKSMYNFKACLNAARDKDGEVVVEEKPEETRFRKPDEERRTPVEERRREDYKRSENPRKRDESSRIQVAPTSSDIAAASSSNSSISPEELNKLSAKLLKAEMMEDDDLIAELKAKIDAAKGISLSEPTILLTSSAKGTIMPANSKKSRTGDELDVMELLREEKQESASDFMDKYLDLAAGKLSDPEKEYGAAGKKSKKQKLKDEKFDVRERERAIQQHRMREEALNKCAYCLEGSRMARHLVITANDKVVVHVPAHEDLVPLHCLISPTQHVGCSVALDEDVYSELNSLTQLLSSAFRKINHDAIFLETNIRLRHNRHCLIECIPVPDEYAESLPFVFRNAINEVGEEWSTNRKLIDVKKKGGLRHAVPKELPYFAVHFPGGAYAHVIENEDSFPEWFGRQVIAGVMDIEVTKYRRPKNEAFEEQMKKVVEFKKFWKEYA